MVRTADKVDSALHKAAEETKAEAQKVAAAVAAKAMVVAEKVADKTAQSTQEAVVELTTAINGRMDQMIQEATKRAFLQGKEAAVNDVVTEQVKALLKEFMVDVQEQYHRHQENNAAQFKLIHEKLADLQEAQGEKS